jgi:hypothetical protein
MASSRDLLHGETEDCCCCCEDYESFTEGITTSSTPSKEAPVVATHEQQSVVVTHEQPTNTLCKKDVCVRRLKENKKCPCALCDGGVIFDGHEVEFDDLEERENVLCLCAECAQQPIWRLKIWDSPNIQTLVTKTAVYASQAIGKNLEQIGKKVEQIGKNLEAEEVLKPRKFCANQEQDAYENEWDNCMG